MSLKPPFDNLRLRYREEPTADRLAELFGGIADNFEWLLDLFPLGTENIANNATGAVVTKLPTSGNYSGRRVLYAVDKSNGIYWELIYDGEGEFPWKYVGGPALYAQVETEQETKSTGFTDLATVGPSVTVPLKGDYDVRMDAITSCHGYAAAVMGFAIGEAAATAADTIEGGQQNTGFWAQQSPSGTRRKTGIAASSLLKAKYHTTDATVGAYFSRRRIWVTPVRVV